MKVEASEARYATAPAISSGSPMRRSGVVAVRRLRLLLVFPQRAGEIGLDQARRHAIDAHALRAPFAGEAAAQREIRRLGNAVGADHGGAAQAADGGDDHDRAVAALGHLRDRLRAEPDVALDVGAHDLVEGLVLDVEQRAVIGVDRGVADEDVDLAVMLCGARDQRLDFLAARDVAGDDMGVAAGLLDAFGDFVTGVRLAAGDHDFGAELCQQLRRGTADAAAGAGDDGDFAGEIERGVFHCCLAPCFRSFSRHCRGLTRRRSTYSARRARVDCCGATDRLAIAGNDSEAYTNPPASVTRRRW